jgi:hypothetical protein
MSGYNTTIGTVIGAPFISNFPLPIDNRMVVDNEAGRLSIPQPVQYEGMVVYQKDTNLLYVLIEPGIGAAAEWATLTTSDVELFPFTGSAIISGSLSVTGPTIITAPTSSATDHLFLVRSTDSADNKFVINLEGVTVLGAFNETPTPVEGGMFYSASGEFYLGS